jgi:hypothetical protein
MLPRLLPSRLGLRRNCTLGLVPCIYPPRRCISHRSLPLGATWRPLSLVDENVLLVYIVRPGFLVLACGGLPVRRRNPTVVKFTHGSRQDTCSGPPLPRQNHNPIALSVVPSRDNEACSLPARQRVPPHSAQRYLWRSRCPTPLHVQMVARANPRATHRRLDVEQFGPALVGRHSVDLPSHLIRFNLRFHQWARCPSPPQLQGNLYRQRFPRRTQAPVFPNNESVPLRKPHVRRSRRRRGGSILG